MKLTLFKNTDFLNAVKALFRELNVPMNYIADEPTTAKEILKDTYKENSTFNLIDDVYFVGMVDDAAFEGNESISTDNIKPDYDGILVFGITLNQRENNLLPTRSQLAEISRAFNREYNYTPVVLVFKYSDDANEYIAFANTERLKYKQEWREGEKAGKVSLLRDINIEKPHRGHEDIINQLKISTTGKNKIVSFAKLYNYWQEVFSVNILNKKFYQELQNWYFWAIKEVTFPNQPNILDENIDGDEAKLKEAIKEHKGKNVIRLLTRILFIWFIKEKKLIPEEIFDEQTIADKLIDDFTPQKPHGVFATGKHNSKYYRAILQNLFFATLNQEMGKRNFRNDKQHQNVTNLMRYKSYFKDPDYFVQLMEDVVPFMNGGLFECLDKPHPDKKGRQGGDIIIYIDGFSDRADNPLVVPDYLFFDVDEDVDLSDDFGSTARVYKNAKTRGLLEILKSYKFTITENTPIEEDVALDPELLGKVFENLLASYNPETKTTARKQTGSFYTPREIVNYMVDESLIAYLKNAITDWNLPEEELDKNLHRLFSFDETNPFNNKPGIQKQIIRALDKAKILDPAVGSGAFPMGILQKMVHVLHKVDPNGQEWKQRQIDKVNNAIENLEQIDDAKFREQSIKELKAQIKDIEDAFENNELDYGRKLFLIENCIYGVDIQSIATQISKLRFFISLIVDQKIDKSKANFGIRPLPNLETKFVAANTLIGIDKPKEGEFTGSLFDNTEVKKLEAQLKKVRHKIFSSKSPRRKRQLREEDKLLRKEIAELLEKSGMENKTARQLASWDPYDQNASSPFFDPEWMFDIKDGFDIVIGNPPYVSVKDINNILKKYLKENYTTATGQFDLYSCFIEKGVNSLSSIGSLSFITSNTFLSNKDFKALRKFLLEKTSFSSIVNLDENVFDTAQVDVVVFNTLLGKHEPNNIKVYPNRDSFLKQEFEEISQNYYYNSKKNFEIRANLRLKEVQIIDMMDLAPNILDDYISLPRGIEVGGNSKMIKTEKMGIEDVPLLVGKNISQFKINYNDIYIPFIENDKSNFKERIIFEQPKILIQRIRNLSLKQRIVAAIDFDNYYCTNTLRIGLLKNVKGDYDLLFILLGLLNSKAVNFYFSRLFINKDIYSYQLQRIPIPKTSSYSKTLILLNKLIVFSYDVQLLQILDAIIFNLYFPEHMKERGIDVLEYVERDIESVMQGREFEDLSDTEKEKVIEQLHKIWTDPDNEVVKRMAQFKEKSPDILKVILES